MAWERRLWAGLWWDCSLNIRAAPYLCLHSPGYALCETTHSEGSDPGETYGAVSQAPSTPYQKPRHPDCSSSCCCHPAHRQVCGGRHIPGLPSLAAALQTCLPLISNCQIIANFCSQPRGCCHAGWLGGKGIYYII